MDVFSEDGPYGAAVLVSKPLADDGGNNNDDDDEDEEDGLWSR